MVQMKTVKFPMAVAQLAGMAVDGSSLIPSDAEGLEFERTPGPGGVWRAYARRCGGRDEMRIPQSEMSHHLDALTLASGAWSLPSCAGYRVKLGDDSWGFATARTATRERDLCLSLMLAFGFHEGSHLWRSYADEELLQGEPCIIWGEGAPLYRLAPVLIDWVFPSCPQWRIDQLTPLAGATPPPHRCMSLDEALTVARDTLALDVLSPSCIVSGLSRQVLAMMTTPDPASNVTLVKGVA